MILFYRWHVLRIYLIWCATVDHLNSDRILVGLLRLVVPFPSGRSISIPSFHFRPLVRFPTLFLFFTSVLALSILLGSGVSAAAPANHADCAALVPLAEVRIEPPDALPKGKAAVRHTGTCVCTFAVVLFSRSDAGAFSSLLLRYTSEKTVGCGTRNACLANRPSGVVCGFRSKFSGVFLLIKACRCIYTTLVRR